MRNGLLSSIGAPPAVNPYPGSPAITTGESANAPNEFNKNIELKRSENDLNPRETETNIA
jgi:hypothetical protein